VSAVAMAMGAMAISAAPKKAEILGFSLIVFSLCAV